MKKLQNFPVVSELKKIRKAAQKIKGSGTLGPHATQVEKMKHELCRQFVIHMNNNELSGQAMAKKLHVSKSRISEIVNYRIGRISIDRLVELLEILKIKSELKIAGNQ